MSNQSDAPQNCGVNVTNPAQVVYALVALSTNALAQINQNADFGIGISNDELLEQVSTTMEFALDVLGNGGENLSLGD